MIGVRDIKNILLRPNRVKDADFSASVRVLNALAKHRCNIYVESQYQEDIPENDAQKQNKLFFLPLEDVLTLADVCIVLGGDGSILDAVRKTVSAGLPILGINLGRIGYMAEVELCETEYLDKLFAGDYTCDERMMLSAVHRRDGETVHESFALNDAVVSKGSVSQVIELELYFDDRRIAAYRSDGMIFATPTGSTAYSMSAGGPIIDPHLGCICVTPVCPHSLGQRPLLFSDSATLTVKNISKREKQLFLTLDGNENFALEYGDTVSIRRSEYKAKLIKLKDTDFYSIVRQKIKNMGE